MRPPNKLPKDTAACQGVRASYRFFDRLVAAGKPKMQAVGACMRKLLLIAYGVLKNRTPFDPLWSSKKTR
jgi:hypothetical protein